MSSLNSCYWCYRCNRSVRVRTREAVVCAECGGGFVERVNTRAQMAESPSHQRSPPQAPLVSSAQRVPISSSVRNAVGAERQRNRVGGERTFHPVIVFRGPEGRSGQHPNSDNTRFNLHYDAGAGQSPRPFPPRMSQLLTGPGLERLFGQLGRVGAVDGCDRRPASKSAVDGLPVIKVEAHHVDGESQCAVCLEKFELDSDAREMPCKHLYHSDCILPRLSVHNSCPVCRHQLPTDVAPAEQNRAISTLVRRLPQQRHLGLLLILDGTAGRQPLVKAGMQLGTSFPSSGCEDHHLQRLQDAVTRNTPAILT